jgi:alanyl-tRNA synthetase
MNESPEREDSPPSEHGVEVVKPNPSQTSEPLKKEVDPRMHSAEHILTAALMEMFQCGRPFTTHLEKKKSKADYHFSRELTGGETQRVEARVNQLIAQDLPVWAEFVSRSSAEQMYNLERLPESAGEEIRIVHVGDYDACPCSGKHVEKTSAIGEFRIVSTTYETGTLRVRFKLGAAPAVP